MGLSYNIVSVSDDSLSVSGVYQCMNACMGVISSLYMYLTLYMYKMVDGTT